MNGFQAIAGLPYCVGAVDGTHVPCTGCPNYQYYEYRSYKGFTSIVVFSVSDARRRFLYSDVEQPGVVGDSIIFQQSSLKELIENDSRLGASIPSLFIQYMKFAHI